MPVLRVGWRKNMCACRYGVAKLAETSYTLWLAKHLQEQARTTCCSIA